MKGTPTISEKKTAILIWIGAEDDERLKALVTQGASKVRAAAALKRRQAVDRESARQLGCPFLLPRDKVISASSVQPRDGQQCRSILAGLPSYGAPNWPRPRRR
jgi:hypothetical protein